jgi:hypothetical protein
MSTYQPQFLPAIDEILDVFRDEISTLGGQVTDTVEDGQRCFARAVLVPEAQVRPNDAVAAGVALRAVDSEILIHPYTFRKVCSNGAIAARVTGTARIERVETSTPFLPSYEAEEALSQIRNTVRACADPNVFAAISREMRSLTEIEADAALQLLPRIAHFPPQVVAQFLPLVFQRFAADGDRTAFGLMNAVTSVARDTEDPETRWKLEELGGSLPAQLRPRPRTTPTASTAGV